MLHSLVIVFFSLLLLVQLFSCDSLLDDGVCVCIFTSWVCGNFARYSMYVLTHKNSHYTLTRQVLLTRFDICLTARISKIPTIILCRSENGVLLLRLCVQFHLYFAFMCAHFSLCAFVLSSLLPMFSPVCECFFFFISVLWFNMDLY